MALIVLHYLLPDAELHSSQKMPRTSFDLDLNQVPFSDSGHHWAPEQCLSFRQTLSDHHQAVPLSMGQRVHKNKST